jgi:flagellar basal body-associated protein FliL
MPVQEEKKAGNGIVIAIAILLVLCILAGAGLYLFG